MMKKKILIILLCSLSLCILNGCGNKAVNADTLSKELSETNKIESAEIITNGMETDLISTTTDIPGETSTAPAKVEDSFTVPPRTSDCICTDRCTEKSMEAECPLCGQTQDWDTVCQGILPELYTEETDNSGPHTYFMDSDEIYDVDFLPVKVWEAIHRSLPIYLKNMSLEKSEELHLVPSSIINTDTEKSFRFTIDAYPGIEIRVSYIDKKLDYTLFITEGGAQKNEIDSN